MKKLGRDDEQFTWRLVIFVLLCWLAQLILILTLPLVADEAYYTRWGERLSWGYLDHPPMVALWSYWGGRWLNALLLPMAWLIFVDSARRLGSRVHPLWFLAAAWSTPLGLASGVLLTPDAPLLFMWSLAVWGWARRLIWLSAAGVILGAWSKAMIWPAALGLGWLWWTDDRGQTPKRDVLLWAILVLIGYFPHINWSWHHDGLPWTFQGGRQWGRFSALEWVAGQFWVGGGAWTFLVARQFWRDRSRAYRAFKLSRPPLDGHHAIVETVDQVNTQKDQRVRLWWWLSAPSFLTWGLMSLGTRVEANWSALAWPTALLWALEASTQKQRKKAIFWSTLVTLPCLFLPLIHQVIPLGMGPPRDSQRLRECIQAIDQPPSRAWITGRYQEAALLGLPLERPAYHLGDEHPVAPPVKYLRAWQRRESQYDLFTQEPIKSLCDTLYIGPREWVGPRCSGQLESVTGTCSLEVTRCTCTGIDKVYPRIHRE